MQVLDQQVHKKDFLFIVSCRKNIKVVKFDWFAGNTEVRLL